MLICCLTLTVQYETVAAESMPELNVVPGVGTSRAGMAHEVSYVLSWEGPPEAFLVFPAEFAPIDGADAMLTSLVSRSDGERSTVEQVLTITPREAGVVQVPEVQIGYTVPVDVAEGATTVTPTPSATLTAAGFDLKVRAPRPGLTWGALLGGVVIVGVSLGLWRWRRQGKRKDTAVATVEERARVLLDDAQRNRLDGDFYGFYQVLCQTATLLQAEDRAPELLGRLERERKAVGYQGLRPTEEDLNGDFKEVARLASPRLEVE